MRRNAIFDIGDTEIQVKEERGTDINFVSWIAEIQFFFSLVFRLVSLFLKNDTRSPGGLNPYARVVPHKKQPADFHATCSTYMGTKLIYSKPGRYFKFSKTQKNTHFFIYFPKIDSYDNKNGKLKL